MLGRSWQLFQRGRKEEEERERAPTPYSNAPEDDRTE